MPSTDGFSSQMCFERSHGSYSFTIIIILWKVLCLRFTILFASSQDLLWAIKSLSTPKKCMEAWIMTFKTNCAVMNDLIGTQRATWFSMTSCSTPTKKMIIEPILKLSISNVLSMSKIENPRLDLVREKIPIAIPVAVAKNCPPFSKRKSVLSSLTFAFICSHNIQHELEIKLAVGSGREAKRFVPRAVREVAAVARWPDQVATWRHRGRWTSNRMHHSCNKTQSGWSWSVHYLYTYTETTFFC